MSDERGYLGAQDQSTGANDYNSMLFHIDQRISEVNTAKLVKIVKGPYDKDGNPIAPGTVGPIGYIDVQPMVNQVDGRGKAMPHGTVHRLSYHRNQGGLGAIINDPVVGDIGKMVVADRDTSSVRATDKVANPGSRRKFDMADGTFVGVTQAKAPDQYVSFKGDGIEIKDKHGNKFVLNADGILIQDKHGNKLAMTSAGCDFTSARVTSTEEITKGFGSGNSVSLGTHTHDGVMTGGGDTSPPNPGT